MATARPWYHFVQERVIAQSDDPDSPGIATTERDDDAALIVAAVNAYDTLRAENARLRVDIRTLLGLLDVHAYDVETDRDYQTTTDEIRARAALTGKEG